MNAPVVYDTMVILGYYLGVGDGHFVKYILNSKRLKIFFGWTLPVSPCSQEIIGCCVESVRVPAPRSGSGDERLSRVPR